MTEPIITTVVTTVETHSVTLSAEKLRTLVGAPPNAEVFIKIPGGGDWSNTILDDPDVNITWRITK
jgi:hypothetical protein